MYDTPSSLTKDDLIAVSKIKNTMTLHKALKRFVTSLSWGDDLHLVNNFVSARTRLDVLFRRLRRDPELRHAYREAMEEYILSQVVERVHNPAGADPSRTNVYYLPYCAVYDGPHISTNCRIAFDDSAKTTIKKRIDDNLVCGPALQLNIIAIELRFHTKNMLWLGT